MIVPGARSVVLVSLPWPRAEHCSIQLGALAAYAERRRVPVVQRYYAKDIEAYVGKRAYDLVSSSDLQQYEAAALLYPEKEAAIASLFARVLGKDFDFQTYLSSVREFYADVVADLLSLEPTLVGFTVSFIQLMPSVYVAAELKAAGPVKVVVGGASMLPHFSGKLLDLYPQVDYIVEGEGEETLVALAAVGNASDEELAAIDGLIFRTANGTVQRNRPRRRLQDLDALPTPDFRGQFTHRLPRNIAMPLLPTITLEASRGCFYGKCSFCNLNCQWDNTFRAKSDRKVLEEIKSLVASERTFRIMFCDTNVSNRISLFRRIRELGLDLDLVLEVSGHADGRQREFYKAIRAAGASQIQIGIEAFSDDLLKLVRKGVTLIKNVELLKWCGESGIRLVYNLLSHIPGERPEDIDATLAAIEFVRCYEPPSNICDFFLGHDSPAWEHPERFGITGWKVPDEPARCYPEEVSRDIAPLVTPIVGLQPISATPTQDWSRVQDAVRRWREEHHRRGAQPALHFRDCGRFVVVEDLNCDPPECRVLKGDHRRLYLACDSAARTVEQVAASTGLPAGRCEALLRELVDARLTFTDGRRYLSLAISRREPIGYARPSPIASREAHAPSHGETRAAAG